VGVVVEGGEDVAAMMEQQGGSIDWLLLPLGFLIYLAMPDVANQCLLSSFTPFPLGPRPGADLHILVVSHNFCYSVLSPSTIPWPQRGRQLFGTRL
jgi:hypothetical protein